MDPTPRPTPPHRVLLTLPDLAVGGGQVIVRNYLRLRDPGRFDVGVVTLRPRPDDMLDELRGLGVEPLCLGHRPGHRVSTVLRLAALLHHQRVEVLHVHGPEDRKIGLAAAALARVPVLCHLHSEWRHLGAHVPPGAGLGRRVRGSLTAAARDALEARVVVEYLADSAPVAEAFRAVVPQPVSGMSQAFDVAEHDRAAAAHDPARWRRQLGLGPGPVVVAVSRLAPGKGHDRLLRAFDAARGAVTDAQLVVVGDGPLRAELEGSVSRLGLEAAVRFVGQRRDVPALLAGADVFAFASTTETFGLVVGEAMAARLPVVAYRLPAIEDYTTDGRTGFFPAQEDEAGYVEGLARLLADPGCRRRFGDAGRAVVERRFHPRATADSFEEAYDRILDTRGRGRRRWRTRAAASAVPLRPRGRLPIDIRGPAAATGPGWSSLRKG